MNPSNSRSRSRPRKLCLRLLVTAMLLISFAALGFEAIGISTLKNTVEKQIVEQVNLGLKQSMEDLEQAVNINSGTMNFAGVAKVGQLYRAQLDALGFTTQWLDGAEFNRAGHLLATRKGAAADGLKILLIGHLDTVFSDTDEFQHFVKLANGFIAGPGITDMKGGNTILIGALRALATVGVLDQISIKVIFTGDEESSGKPLAKSKHALVEAAKWADIALGFEDGDSDIKTAVIARRGSVDWRLSVSSKTAHSSQIFQPKIGPGAIFETARILNAFREQLAGYGDLTFNPAIITGGTQSSYDPSQHSGFAFGKNNVIAKTVEVSGGLRALSADELRHAKTTMTRIVADNLPHTQAQLVIGEGYPPLAPSAGNRALLAAYSAVSEDLGYGPVVAVNPRNAGAADISFTAGHVDQALDGLGLMGRGGHTRQEAADISSLAKNTQKAALLIYRLGLHSHAEMKKHD